MPLHIALVGCGNMGQAILTSWLKEFPNYTFTVVTSDGQPKSGLQGVSWTSPENLNSISTADYIVFAVKPQVLETILSAYKPFSPKAFLSIAAGKTVSFYRDHLPLETPFIRLMPNTPAAVQAGITAAHTPDNLTASLSKDVEQLVQAFGDMIWVDDEEDFHTVTALSGSGPAYLFHFIEALTNAAIETGLTREVAQKLAEKTIVGAAKYFATSTQSASNLKKAVTSKGGTTEAGLTVLEKDLTNILKGTLEAATQRSRDLS